MSKARSTGNIGNIIKTSATCVTVNDGTTDLLIMSGSGRVTIPGNLVVLGGISGSSAESSSYSLSSSFATNANFLDGIDGASFLQTGSFNTFSSSIDTTIKNKLNGDGVISGSIQVDITSTTGYSTFSSSLSSSIGSLSGSVATTTSGLSSSIGSLSSSVATTTSGLASRIGSVEAKTGSYATTGSNVFIGSQVITGSLYITNDMIVQGCSCLQNITASAVSIGTNVVMLNTATPALRFAGISVQDSGSNAGVTGSIYWDGLCNKWIYSNPSDIGYSGGMLISGPRSSTLGSEAPLTCNYIAKSGGGDHIYDSCIIDDGTSVCVKGSLVTTGVFTVISEAGSTSMVLGQVATTNPKQLLISNVTGSNYIRFQGIQQGIGYNQNIIFQDGGGCVGIGTSSPRGLLHLYGAEVAAYKTYTGQANTGGGDTIINAYRLDGPSNYLRVTDIVALGDDTNNRGSSIRLMTTNTSGVTSAALTLSSTGYVGIGTNCPLQILHISATTPTLFLSDCAATGNGGNVYITAAKSGVGYNNLTMTAYTYNFKGGGSETSYLSINSAGASCFASSISATAITATGLLYGNGGESNTLYTGAFFWTPGSYNFFNQKTDHSLVIGTYNSNNPVAALTIAQSGISTFACQVCAKSLWFSSNATGQITFGSNDACNPYIVSDSSNVLYLGNNNSYKILIPQDGSDMVFRTSPTYANPQTRLTITAAGIACFACQVCAPALVSTGGISLHGNVKTFALTKYFNERESGTGFFKIYNPGGNGFSAVIHLMSQNPSVGWSQAQVYQAVSAPYWGGWVGSTGQISSIGGSSGYISSASVSNNGCISFYVTTGNNGTNTTMPVLAYIQITSFDPSSITVTAL